MKKTLTVLLFALALTANAQAQTTVVTGTATDSQATPYILGTWTANLKNTSSAQPTWQGSTSFQTSYSGSLDNTGAVSVTLPSNTSTGAITVGGLTTTQWTFSICALDGGSCFTSSVTITGASQSITASLVNSGRITFRLGAPNQPPCGSGQAVVSVGTSWGCSAGAAIGPVAGSDTQVQFNDAGSFGGDAGLTYNKTTDTLSTSIVSLPNTTTSTTGILNLGGSSFVHAYPGIANFNTFVGNVAGNFTLTGTSNTGVGYQTLKALTSGSQNTAIGRNVLQAVTSGNLNTGAGYFALNGNLTGSNNTAFGVEALQVNTSGSLNTAIGAVALQLNTTGASNVAVGNTALQLNTTGLNSVAIGDSALQSAQLSANVIGIGQGAMQYATEVNNNDSDVCMGTHCLYQSTNSSYNIGIGRAALYGMTTGQGNIGIGFDNSFLAPPDGLTLTLSNGTANLGIGVYAYKVAFTLNGVVSDLQDTLNQTITTDASHQEVSLSAIPTYSGPLTCTARKIYRTKVGFVLGRQKWYLVTTIADNTTTTFVDTVADASLVTEDSSPSFSTIIGYVTDQTGRTCYKSNQFCLGTDAGPTTEMWLGRSVYSATPSDILVSASGGSGTNTAGANLILSGGPSTGTAASGKVIFKAAAAGGSGSAWNAVGEVAEVNSTGLQASTYQTATNCSSSASPAVCGSAAAGSVAVPTGTNPTLVVNTTAVTANSQIFLNADESLGIKLGITCNSTLASLAVEPVVTARTAATSFTVQISGVISTNAVCLSYFIVN